MLVGFQGGVWSGGGFEVEADTPEQAAELAYKEHGDEFPGGREEIEQAIVTDYPKLACWLRREGDKFIIVGSHIPDGPEE